MGMGVSHKISVGMMLAVGAVLALRAQEPPAGRGGGAGRGGPPPATQAPAVPQISRSPVVDQAAHDRGRALWASHCIDCHGSQARGSDTGPNIIRSKTVNFDRTAAQAGSVLGPFLKAGHPTQSQKPSASFTDAEVVDLANFLRQRVNDTMRGSAMFTAGDVLVGNAKAGEAYSTARAGARPVTTRPPGISPGWRRGFLSRSTCSNGCCSPGAAGAVAAHVGLLQPPLGGRNPHLRPRR